MSLTRRNFIKRMLLLIMTLVAVSTTPISVFAQDTDGDGYADEIDFCPSEGDFGLGVDEFGCPYEDSENSEIDSDFDGYSDAQDACPFQGDEGLGLDGAGCPLTNDDVDSDFDGYPDAQDVCPFQGDEGLGLDAAGCPLTNDDVDSDFDGYPDAQDVCPFQGDGGFGLDGSGCPISNDDVDSDFDGYPDAQDVCPFQGDEGLGLDGSGCPLANDDVDSGFDSVEENTPDEYGLIYDLTCIGDQPQLIVFNTGAALASGELSFTYESESSTFSDTLPAIETGGALDPLVATEDFTLYVAGQAVAQVSLDDCINGEGTDNDVDLVQEALRGLPGQIIESTTFENETVLNMSFTEETTVYIGTSAAAVNPIIEVSANGSLVASSLDGRAVFVADDSDYTFEIYLTDGGLGGLAISTLEPGIALVGSDNELNINIELMCDGNQEVVSLINNGDSITAGTVVVGLDLLESGQLITDVFPDLDRGGNIPLPPFDENYTVTIDSREIATIDSSSCNEGSATLNANNVNISADLICDPTGAIIELTNNGTPIIAGSVDVEVTTFAGESVADKLPALGSGEKIPLPPINENFAVTVNGEQIASVDLAIDCGAPQATAEVTDGQGSSSLSYENVCDANGITVAITNTGDTVDTFVLFGSDSDGLLLEFAEFTLEPGERTVVRDSLQPVGGIFHIGEELGPGYEANITDCEVPVATAEVTNSESAIQGSYVCDGLNEVVRLTNTGDPITGGVSTVELVITDTGETISDTLPAMTSGQILDLPSFDGNYQVSIDRIPILSVESTFCNAEASATPESSVVITPDFTCDTAGAIIELTNNGASITAGTIDVEVVTFAGESIIDKLPALSNGQSISLPPINENFRVLVDGIQIASIDIALDCNTTTTPAGNGNTDGTPSATEEPSAGSGGGLVADEPAGSLAADEPAAANNPSPTATPNIEFNLASRVACDSNRPRITLINRGGTIAANSLNAQVVLLREGEVLNVQSIPIPALDAGKDFLLEYEIDIPIEEGFLLGVSVNSKSIIFVETVFCEKSNAQGVNDSTTITVLAEIICKSQTQEFVKLTFGGEGFNQELIEREFVRIEVSKGASHTERIDLNRLNQVGENIFEFQYEANIYEVAVFNVTGQPYLRVNSQHCETPPSTPPPASGTVTVVPQPTTTTTLNPTVTPTTTPVPATSTP